MASDVYKGSTKIGRVSTSGEVYYHDCKVGWVNGNGDMYREGSWVGWITRAGNVLDVESNKIGFVDRAGYVYKGSTLVGRTECASNRYYIGGAALLLLLYKPVEQPLHQPEPVLRH